MQNSCFEGAVERIKMEPPLRGYTDVIVQCYRVSITSAALGKSNEPWTNDAVKLAISDWCNGDDVIGRNNNLYVPPDQ